MTKLWSCLLVFSLPFLLGGCAALSSMAEVVQFSEEPSNDTQSIQPTPSVVRVEITPTAITDDHNVEPILFVSDRGTSGTTDIYQMNADGSGLIRLTNDPASERDPVWSPDRKHMAFTSDSLGINQIFIMSMESYEVRQLTDHPKGGESPTWSPDSTMIAFVEPNADSNNIFIIPADFDGDIEPLSVEHLAPNSLAWSPAGDKIAFSAQVEGGVNERDIFSYDIDKQSLINLTNEAGLDDNPAWSFDGNMLTFQSMRDGNENIYVMRADGALQTPLTTDPKADVEPSWSNNGRLILFSSNRGGSFNIFVMNDNGSSQTSLNTFPANDRQPQWAAAPLRISNEIVFASGIFTEFRDLLLTNAEGTTRVQLTENNNSDDTIPDWSPDGNQIVFSSSRDGNYDIFTMKVDSSNWVKLTTDIGDDKHPSWSPDGKKIAFESKQGDDDWDVWVMDADGNNLQNITADEGANDGNPTWSPDGKEIAFSSNRQGSYDIYKMSADGSGLPIRLTGAETDDFHPDWAPNEMLIAYRATSSDSGKRDISLVSVNGRSVRSLFSSQANDDTPAWSPDGNRIAFASDRQFNDEANPDGVYRIYVYDLETGLINQTSHGNRDGRYPAWRQK